MPAAGWRIPVEPEQRTDVPMFEYACHEGNYSLPNILAGQRAEEKATTALR